MDVAPHVRQPGGVRRAASRDLYGLHRRVGRARTAASGRWFTLGDHLVRQDTAAAPHNDANAPAPVLTATEDRPMKRLGAVVGMVLLIGCSTPDAPCVVTGGIAGTWTYQATREAPVPGTITGSLVIASHGCIDFQGAM